MASRRWAGLCIQGRAISPLEDGAEEAHLIPLPQGQSSKLKNKGQPWRFKPVFCLDVLVCGAKEREVAVFWFFSCYTKIMRKGQAPSPQGVSRKEQGLSWWCLRCFSVAGRFNLHFLFCPHDDAARAAIRTSAASPPCPVSTRSRRSGAGSPPPCAFLQLPLAAAAGLAGKGGRRQQHSAGGAASPRRSPCSVAWERLKPFFFFKRNCICPRKEENKRERMLRPTLSASYY